jgi:hypothetical protein
LLLPVAGVSGMEKLLGVVSVGNLGWDRTISRLLVAFKTINIMVVHAIVSRTWGELAWIEIDDRLMHWRRTRRASASLVCYCFCSLSTTLLRYIFHHFDSDLVMD